MNSRSPPGEPAFTSLPDPVSPVSPKPVSYPLPSSIPVLANQIDLGFNQTEAHVAKPVVQTMTAMQEHESLISSSAEHASPTALSGDQVPLHPMPSDSREARFVEPIQESVTSHTDQAEHSIATAEPRTDELHDTAHALDTTSYHDVVYAASGPAEVEAHVQVSSFPENDLTTNPSPASAPIVAGNGAIYDGLLKSLNTTPISGPTPNEHDANNSASSALSVAAEPLAPTADTGTDESSVNATHEPRPTTDEGAAPADGPEFSDNGVYAVKSEYDDTIDATMPDAAVQPHGAAPSEKSATVAFVADPSKVSSEEDKPWSEAEEAAFEEFIKDERRYMAEGNWEQFEYGTRLFIGDVHIERVSTRDIFRVFHKHGKLAQIAMKQAYGFIQFVKLDEGQRAMHAEQGRMIRGRKINLEISKPQKNRIDHDRQRSRSPRGRNRRSQGDRYRSDRDPPLRRGRDDYRPGQSPDRGYRGRGDSRDRYRYRSRSRSFSRDRRDGRYRDQKPQQPNRDLDDLPLPRRQPHAVPEVQIIVTGELDRNFIAWIERSFRDRGVRVDVLLLSPILSEAAVIRRQIIEGVLAVSKVDRMSQQIVKIPLQVFDRRGGADVRFEEYADLDPSIAAEIVLRARSTNATTAPAPAPAYGYGYGYGAGNAAPPQAAPLPVAPLAPAVMLPAQGPDLSKLIGSMDANGLQQLLGAMQQPMGQKPPAMQQAPPNLSHLMAHHAAPQYGGPGPPSYPRMAPYPVQPSLPIGQSMPQQGQRPVAPGQPDMANILAKLGSYR